jgi:ABC-type amino acid transport substrate-binding protein
MTAQSLSGSVNSLRAVQRDGMITQDCSARFGLLTIARRFFRLVVLAVVSCLIAAPALGQVEKQAAVANPPLRIVTKLAPPFSMKKPDGAWHGLAIDLMGEVALKLNRTIVWQEVNTTPELLAAFANGGVDGGIAAITVTAEREKSVDFSHAYYDSGLAIAVRKKNEASFFAGLKALGSPAFLGTVGMLVCLLLVTGAVVWLLEKHRNPEQFEKHPIKGIGSGFWWAAVTMTTVGYGDKAPITALGRFVAVIWMFAALILTAVFTAQLTTALTLHRLTGPVAGVADLSRNRVGVVDGTASRDYFTARSMWTIPYASIKDGLEALEAGQIAAFVHDQPILRYEVQQKYLGKLELLPDVFDAQVYGIALPTSSPLRETVNRRDGQ